MPAPSLTTQLRQWLDEPSPANEWLRHGGIRDQRQAVEAVVAIGEAGVPFDVLAEMSTHFGDELAQAADPDQTLANLKDFFLNARSPREIATLLAGDSAGIPALLRVFDASQPLSKLLIRAPETIASLLRIEEQPVADANYAVDLATEIEAAEGDLELAAERLRACKRREILRIAYGDLIGNHRPDVVMDRISYLADTICAAAVQAARAHLLTQYGTPRRPGGQQVRYALLGWGNLGGKELDYSGDLDLVFLYESDGKTSGPKFVSSDEYHVRLTQLVIKLLSESDDVGAAYQINLRLLPFGDNSPPALSADDLWTYYDTQGRTWERLAYVKARPVAGDLDLAQELVDRLQPWVYRRYLSQAHIASIQAIKRHIERHVEATDEFANLSDVRNGRGGIHDIEYVIQFLQLLNGGDLPEIRTPNTLAALSGLQQQGCLTLEERSRLEKNYLFLRTIEHRIQILFDLRRHTLPEEGEALRRLAVNSLPAGKDTDVDAVSTLQAQYEAATKQNRTILDRLMHDAFGDAEGPEPEVDLVLDPEPSAELKRSALEPYGFQNQPAAYEHLMQLAAENVPFLSSLRCRHFLAAIAPKLLRTIAATPHADDTLANLSRVSASLGGKGVLWELFSTNPALMDLYVRLCAACPYLSGILISNPGMLDDLIDSLILDRLPTWQQLYEELVDLCQGAEDIEPILHGFKNSMHLTVGVRDILGKEDVRATTATLSDVAEVCLQKVILNEYHKLAVKFGIPASPVSAKAEPLTALARPDQGHLDEVGLPQEQGDCELVVLGMGKFGGREPNYHSNLKVIFVYEVDGHTRHPQRSRGKETTTNKHFFGELAQRVLRFINRFGPWGRLYEIDAQLRPSSHGITLAISRDELGALFQRGDNGLWERLALCKARPIFGSRTVRQQVLDVVHNVIRAATWTGASASSIQDMREALEETATKQNLKRGPGGTVDVEFTVQMLQLRHAAEHPEILVPGTLRAIDALLDARILETTAAEYLASSYRFLRSVEARLRLMDTTARHDLPADDAELAKLAYLLNVPSGQEVVQRCQYYTVENRKHFERLFAAAMNS